MRFQLPGRRGRATGILLALLAAVGFSAKAILVKLAYRDGVDAVTLLALRMAFSVPFFLGIFLWARARHAEPLGRHDRILVLGLGLVGYYLSSYLDFLGLQYISAGLERLILFLYPTITVVLSAIVYRQPIGLRIAATMSLCYAGIALVFLHDLGTTGTGTAMGSALVFASAIAYAIYLVGAGHSIGRIGALRFTAFAMLASSAASIGQFALVRHVEALALPLRVYELAFAMAVLSTVLPVLFLSFAIHRIGSGPSSLVGSVGPVSTIFLAQAFLHEDVSVLQIAGSALVLAGVLLLGLGSRREAQSGREPVESLAIDSGTGTG